MPHSLRVKPEVSILEHSATASVYKLVVRYRLDEGCHSSRDFAHLEGKGT